MNFGKALSDCYSELMTKGIPDEGVMHVSDIDGLDGVRLGINTLGCVVVLPVDVSTDAQSQELEHILIIPRVRFEVGQDNEEIVEEVSMVATKGHDAWLVETFLDLIGILLDVAVSEGRLEDAHLFVLDLVALFRAMSQSGKKEAQGLWGELFLIWLSKDVEMSIASWHSTPNDRFDFARGAERLEVKTTTGPRMHRFSHSQLIDNPLIEVVVASLVLDLDPEGQSCVDLVQEISARCGEKALRHRLLNQVVLTLGENWRNQTSVRFNIDMALQNLSFYSIDQIPRIGSLIPLGVLDVSYRSDLQGVPSIDISRISDSHVLLTNFCAV